MVSSSKTKQDLSNKVSTNETVNIGQIGFSSKDAVSLAGLIASGQVAQTAAVATALRTGVTPTSSGQNWSPLQGGDGTPNVMQASATGDGTAPAPKSLMQLIVDNIGIVAAAAGIGLVLYTHKR